MKSRIPAIGLFVGIGLLVAGCHFDFPLTAKPTRLVDSRLIGDWVYVDVDGQRIEHLNIRKLDDSTFVVSCDGELYRAFHSDFAGEAFISVQDLQPGPGKYLYLVYQISSDGTKLGLRCVDPKFIPETVKDQTAIQEFIKQNLNDPRLFEAELMYGRRKN
jgi:hypothetical protein